MSSRMVEVDRATETSIHIGWIPRSRRYIEVVRWESKRRIAKCGRLEKRALCGRARERRCCRRGGHFKRFHPLGFFTKLWAVGFLRWRISSNLLHDFPFASLEFWVIKCSLIFSAIDTFKTVQIQLTLDRGQLIVYKAMGELF